MFQLEGRKKKTLVLTFLCVCSRLQAMQQDRPVSTRLISGVITKGQVSAWLTNIEIEKKMILVPWMNFGR